MMRRLLIGLFAILLVAGPQAVSAVNPDEILADPALEARAREISRDLRCLVCQNQSIDDSDATLARDLRVLVRERLTAGDTNEEVKQYLVDRYGEYVLLNPVWAPHTLLLWLAAPAIFIIGLIVILAARRKPSEAPQSAALSPDEVKALEQLAQDEPQNGPGR